MKRLLLLIVLVLLFGCEKIEEAKKVSERKVYKKAREIAALDTIIVTDIFLSFKFGDTEREFNRKKKTLVREKKLDNNNNWNVEYETYSKEMKEASFFMLPEFHKGKLNKLKLVGEVDDVFYKGALWLYMFQLILDKYDFDESMLDQKYNSSYSGLFHNMEIKLHDNIHDQVIIEYTNLRTENLINNEAAEKSNINKSKHADDL
ncbi:MAG: hypothetical protein P9M11_04515 [Candidatus Tenebribacter burtonii]|nr:hypothetical protein [Candidatus Tenebribacter burtonii]